MVTDRTTLVVFAIAAVVGILAIITVDIILTAEEVEGQKNKNCPRPSQISPGFNNAQKHCIP